MWGDSAYPVSPDAYVPSAKLKGDRLRLGLLRHKRNLSVTYLKMRNSIHKSQLSESSLNTQLASSKKGRFHSLKQLCVHIKDQQSHTFTTHWIAACIGIHTFAMMCEDDEQCAAEHSGDGADDP